jgi:hypothetical protein
MIHNRKPIFLKKKERVSNYMSTMGKNMLKFCIDNMSKITLMNDDDGNNDYGSIIKSTLIKKTMSC